MKKKIDYTLYLITDRGQEGRHQFEHTVEQAIQGGVTVVQFREKEGDTRLLYKGAAEVKKITDAYKVPFIINDRIDIMLACGADGVHLGQSDMPAAVARTVIGEEAILGVSVHNEEEAVKAEKDGADYIGVGAMFPTKTKSDATLVSLDVLRGIQRIVKIPVVVIGGIKKETISAFKNIPVEGFAVVSALMGSDKPKEEAQTLKEEIASLRRRAKDKET